MPLDPGERQLAEFYGAVGHRTGGKLIVTNQRLIFQPWDLSLAGDLIKYGCKLVSMPHSDAVNYIVGKLVGIVDRTAQGVGDMVKVEPVGMASIFNLPKIGVTKDDGSYAEFGVVHSPATPNASGKNNEARDQLVLLLQNTFLIAVLSISGATATPAGMRNQPQRADDGWLPAFSCRRRLPLAGAEKHWKILSMASAPVVRTGRSSRL